MQDFEKLGAFYLGRPYDLAARKRGRRVAPLRFARPGHARRVRRHDGQRQDRPVPRAARGSRHRRRAGHCDRPEGRPGQPAAHLPRTSGRRTSSRGSTPTMPGARACAVSEYAAQQAALWKKGLAEWGQDGERIARLQGRGGLRHLHARAAKPACRCRSSRRSRRPAARSEGEALRERVMTTVSSLLGLLGLDADPVRSREHILLSTILQTAWSRGAGPRPRRADPADPGAADRARRRDRPRVVLPGEGALRAWRCRSTTCSRRPASRRGWRASRSTCSACSTPPDGRPRVSIFSIAHLGDAERMFFVSLLLEPDRRVDAAAERARRACARSSTWTRSSATSRRSRTRRPSCRCSRCSSRGAPSASAPSSRRRTRWTSTTRACRTPAPGSSGRLQTERDKARVIEGLEGASAAAGRSFDRGQMEQTLAGLGSRVFLMNNVHEEAPVVFESRWALCYLRGPLGPPGHQAADGAERRQRTAGSGQQTAARQRPAGAGQRAADQRPLLPGSCFRHQSPGLRPLHPLRRVHPLQRVAVLCCPPASISISSRFAAPAPRARGWSTSRCFSARRR